jgi:RNA polymerase sigma factor (sigma-70 family)
LRSQITPELSNDFQIWAGIKAGDVSALKDLYLQYYQLLFNYGRKMSKDLALIEDAIQETFISIWKYRATTSVPASVKQYLLKTFRNELVKTLKQQSLTGNSEEVVDFTFEISFDQKIIEGENSQRLSAIINNALMKLTSRQREIIYYRFYEGLSFQEISDLMNMQTRATYKLTARALETLKVLLGKRVFLLLLP